MAARPLEEVPAFDGLISTRFLSSSAPRDRRERWQTVPRDRVINSDKQEIINFLIRSNDKESEQLKLKADDSPNE